MTEQQTLRSSPIQEATKPTNVAARIHSFKNWWTSGCLVNCSSTGKDATSKLYAVQSSHDSRKTSWRNLVNTWTTLSSIWRRNSKDKISIIHHQGLRKPWISDPLSVSHRRYSKGCFLKRSPWKKVFSVNTLPHRSVLGAVQRTTKDCKSIPIAKAMDWNWGLHPLRNIKPFQAWSMGASLEHSSIVTETGLQPLLSWMSTDWMNRHVPSQHPIPYPWDDQHRLALSCMWKLFLKRSVKIVSMFEWNWKLTTRFVRQERDCLWLSKKAIQRIIDGVEMNIWRNHRMDRSMYCPRWKSTPMQCFDKQNCC